MLTFHQRVPVYRCPQCGLPVPRKTVEDAPVDALFACDCGWQGDAADLSVVWKDLYGTDALRVAEPAAKMVN